MSLAPYLGGLLSDPVWRIAWQQVREREQGPRYVEAIRGAREMRYIGFTRVDTRSLASRALPEELAHGMPASWHRLG